MDEWAGRATEGTCRPLLACLRVGRVQWRAWRIAYASLSWY